MKLISWNVNGIRACLTKGFAETFKKMDADIFCIQETKCQPEQVELEFEGYTSYWNSAEKKGYSGTAIFTKQKPLNVTYGIGIEEHDKEGRVITLEFEEFYMVDIYTPNSKRELERLDYRQIWEDEIRKYLLKLNETKPVIMCGDLNVAHEKIDLKNPKTNRKNAGFTDEERQKMTELLDAGFTDTFRYLYPDKENVAEKNNWIENLNLNYRMGGLDIFSLLAWNDTYRHLSQTTETTIMGNQHQVNLAMPYSGTLRSHNPYGKWGMNYQIDDNNSFGVFYSVYNNTYEYFNLQSDYEVKEDGKHTGKVKYDDDESSTIQGPVHEADAYYEGKLGKMSVNLNATALWSSDKTFQDAVEMSEELGSRDVNSITRNKRRMLAGKLELGYPLFEKVNLNVGTEYTNSHVHNFYQNGQEYIATSDSRIEEQNFAAFANIDLAIGNHIGLQAGARYEHVSHDCSEREMSRTYDNVFPTFSLGYQKGKLQMEWSASMKTQRPSYDVLSGFTRYDNRYIYEGGNPSLLPTNIYNLGWDVQYGWLGFSANYGYNKHAITTLEMLYDTTSDILLSKPYNIDYLQVMDLSFVATPVFGFWHPMWELDFEQQFVNGEKYGYHGNLRKPQFSVRLNNWFSLSHDWSANVDYFISSSHSSGFSEVGSVSALNLSVKKMFLKKSLSIQLEANDLFHGLNDNQKSFATCMSMFKKCKMNSRSFVLTVTYNFNATKSKYKGTGAGNAEKSRL